MNYIWSSLFFVIFICFCTTKTVALNCNLKQPVSDFENVLDKGLCTELPIGQSKIVNFDKSNSPTGVSHKYELTKVSANKFKIRLNLRFKENTVEPSTAAFLKFKKCDS